MCKINFIILTSAVCCYLLASVVDGGSGPVDFAEIVQDKLNFIDKTMMIADFKLLPRAKIITTPPQFGKSAIIDMLKRFYSIPVDSKGRHIQPNTTANYRLFCDNKLKICENKTFMDKYFGRYPVIHIDYHSLGNCSTFEMLLHNLLPVISTTFKEHEYLKHDETLFIEHSRQFFEERCNMSGENLLNVDDIEGAFSWLADLLKRKYGTKPIVLIDEYDAYGHQFAFEELIETEQSLNLLYRMTRKIFDQNLSRFHRGMLAGVFRMTELGEMCVEANSACRWLGDHRFAKYYGFTESEVRLLISRHRSSEEQINEIMEQLEMYYGGYVVKNQNLMLYNMWSVFHFIKEHLGRGSVYEPTLHNPRPYWRMMVRLKTFDTLYNIEFMEMLTRQLIHGTGLYGDVEKSFNQMDIIQMKCRSIENTRKLFTIMLYDVGFLVPDYSRNVRILQKYQLFKVPNFEIQLDLASYVNNFLVYSYSYKQKHVDALYKAVSSFRCIENNTQNFEDFYHTLERVLVNNNDHKFKKRSHLYNFLFTLFSSTFANGRRDIGWLVNLESTIDHMPKELKGRVSAIKRAIKREKNRFTNTSRIGKGKSDLVIYTGNPERIALVLEIRVLRRAAKIKRALDELAWNTLTEALSYDPDSKKHCELLFDYKCIKPKGKIYIGMSIYLPTKDMSMAFYFVPFGVPYLVESTFEPDPH